MKFVIRDDDLNYFSSPDDIKKWYGDIFEEKIPVGFSAIPFVKPISDVYTGGEQFNVQEYPISGNAELAAYIKDQPMIEIMQHGSTHENQDGIYEYASRNGLIEATTRGNKELEKITGKRVNIFVPPHDWIGSHGIGAIELAGMNIIRGRGAGLRNIIFRKEYLQIFLKMIAFRFPKYISTTPPVYPFVLDFGKHKEMCSYRIEDLDVFDGLDRANKRDGNFVVVNHLHNFDASKKEKLVRLIQKARTFKAEFVYPSDLFN